MKAVRAVYLHAPFCARRCTYCDFAIHVGRDPDPRAWLDAVEREWRDVLSRGSPPVAERLDTLYVGGGTPSLLGPEVMDGVREFVGEARLDGASWAAEANPESFTDAVARGWARAGVDRVSLGVQSFHGPTLRWMGRLHGPDGPVRAVAAARGAGIEDVSVDLVFGLPARLGRPWRADLDRALDLEPTHVSLYGLTVEEGTHLARRVREGREEPVDDETYREEYLLAAELLTGAGYEHYEVSSFARPGFRSRHNAVYWSDDPWLGLGNGAHSHADGERWWNLRGWPDYRAALEAGRSPVAGRERPDPAARRLESVWLGLRTREGWPLPGSAPAAARALAEDWVRRGLARIADGRVGLTAEGWLLLDDLALRMDAALPGAGGGRGERPGRSAGSAPSRRASP